MTTEVNVSDRRGLEDAYPRQDFLDDGQKNAVSLGNTYFGLLIEDAPDRLGRFHVGKHALSRSTTPGRGGLLLCPFRGRGYRVYRLAGDDTPVRASAEIVDAVGPNDYDEFISAVVQNARGLRKTSRLDPYRLMGFQ